MRNSDISVNYPLQIPIIARWEDKNNLYLLETIRITKQISLDL
jgi:hypothetical protein